MAKKALNAIASAIADPLLRKAAERFAASIPEDSWLRSEIVERILAGLKGLAESYKGSGLSGLFVEKATDFFDFASSKLFDKKAGGFEQLTQNWLNQFWKDAQKILSETPAEKLQEARERILKDFEIRKEIFKVIMEAEKEFQPPKKKPDPINWAEWDTRLNNWVENNRPSWVKKRPVKGGSK
jgi:hypothetical protein